MKFEILYRILEAMFIVETEFSVIINNYTMIIDYVNESENTKETLIIQLDEIENLSPQHNYNEKLSKRLSSVAVPEELLSHKILKFHPLDYLHNIISKTEVEYVKITNYPFGKELTFYIKYRDLVYTNKLEHRKMWELWQFDRIIHTILDSNK